MILVNLNLTLHYTAINIYVGLVSDYSIFKVNTLTDKNSH